MTRLSRRVAVALLLAATPPAFAQPRDSGRIGGLELLLEADSADFARKQSALIEDAIRRAMGRRAAAIASISTADGSLSIRVRNRARLSQVLQLAQTQGSALGWIARIATGNNIVMRETPSSRARALEDAMEATRQVILHRTDTLGAREVSVVRQDANRLLVRVVGIRDPAAARALILPTARLAFRLVDGTVAPDQLYSGRAPAGTQLLPYPEGGEGARVAVRREAIVTGAMISSARQGFDAYSERPVVNVAFNDEGRRRFARATRENVGKPFAIVLDDVVLSAPNISEPILGGTAQISGNFTIESANQLAAWLSSGALPVRMVVVENRAPRH